MSFIEYPNYSGAIVEDLQCKKWKIGKRLGKGRSGQVFLASEDIIRNVADDTPYTVKIGDYFGTGLNMEARIYSKLCNGESVRKWINEMDLKNNGIPHIYGYGCAFCEGKKIYFVILQRLGPDLSCLEADNRLSIGEISIQLLNILEYIHIHGFTHDDIKAENILYGYEPENRNNIYLVDFGVSFPFRYSDGSYNGKEEYGFLTGAEALSSRDSHVGLYSRRSDIESLAFNIIIWSGGKLPWMDLDDEERVLALKRKMMKHIPFFLETCFPNGIPQGIDIFMDHVAKLTFEERPYYMVLKNMIREGLKKRNSKMEKCIWKCLPFEEDMKVEKERKRGLLESWYLFLYFSKLKKYFNLIRKSLNFFV